MIAEIEYARVGGISLRMDLYPARNGGQIQPVVLWIHGGGWCQGDKVPCLAESLTHRGYAVASINHRFTQQAPWPAQLHDCKAAVRYLRAHAAKYQLDPQRIGAWGHSAGGHLAALLGVTGCRSDLEGDVGITGISSRIQAACNFSGPTDLYRTIVASQSLPPEAPRSAVLGFVGGSPPDNRGRAEAMSPVTYVDANAAPFLTVHGDADHLVPFEQASVLHEALQAAGVETHLHRVPGGGHVGWEYDVPIHEMAATFFDRHLTTGCIS
jgi:acetyl esterase/lipase